MRAHVLCLKRAKSAEDLRFCQHAEDMVLEDMIAPEHREKSRAFHLRTREEQVRVLCEARGIAYEPPGEGGGFTNPA